MIRLLALLIGLVALVPAAAHTRSESHTSWLVDGSSVHLTVSVPDVEARRVTADGRPPNDPQLIAYLAPKVGASAGGKACAPAIAPRAVAAATGYRRVEFLYNCPSAEGIALRFEAFFED